MHIHIKKLKYWYIFNKKSFISLFFFNIEMKKKEILLEQYIILHQKMKVI